VSTHASGNDIANSSNDAITASPAGRCERSWAIPHDRSHGHGGTIAKGMIWSPEHGDTA
jgi:hypothetical protein